VAWLDLLAPAPQFGRGIVSRGDSWPLAPGVAPLRTRHRGQATPASLGTDPLVEIPDRVTSRVLRTPAIRAFNAARWRRAPRHERAVPVALGPYLFPLDVLGGWNRLYGPAGFVQYQFVVPDAAVSELMEAISLLARRRLPVYLAVAKRLGSASPGPLSFPLAGWTVALDLPADAPGLDAGLEALDDIVLGCGGRVYLSKDARLRPERLVPMYPRLGELRRQCERVDPDGVLSSDLARRVRIRAVDE
jgi:decaprenylphospho-beta-D-ribofuranose 2-oxidase